MPTAADLLRDALNFHQSGRLEEAEDLYRQILATQPANPDALHLLGLIRRRLGHAVESVDLIAQALRVIPDNPVFHNNLGISLLALGQTREAETHFRTALQLKADFVEAMVNLASALRTQGKLTAAIDIYHAALELRPNLVELHNNLGNALRDLGRLREATDRYARALELRPDYVEALNNLGVALKDQDRLEEATSCYRKALALNPNNADTLCNLAAVLKDQGRLIEAIECYRAAISFNPEDASARWSLAMAQIPLVYRDPLEPRACRRAFDAALGELEEWFTPARLDAGAKAVGSEQPYYLAYQEEDNHLLLARYGALCGRLMAHWQGTKEKRHHASLSIPAFPIRIGIVSSHIQDHSVWHALIKGWLSRMDRNRFQLHVFSLGHIHDTETEAARSYAHSFSTGLGTLSNWIREIRAKDLHTLIYPEIGMDPMAVKLASLRLAPLQFAAWGHPETTGLPTMDYYLSAEDMEPSGAERHYTESLIRLPNLGGCYEPLAISPEQPDLGAWSLDMAELLLCPGTPYKYLPQHDWVWAEIARRLPGHKLVFFTHRRKELSEILRKRLCAAFTTAGLVMDEHVTFIPWLNRAQFYGLMTRSVAYLDTIGFSGFNTAMQAVECGLPIVTMEGKFLRGRLASGILNRVGLSECVASSLEGYISLATKLALDPAFHRRTLNLMKANRHILFDDQEPIRALEDRLTQLVADRHSDRATASGPPT